MPDIPTTPTIDRILRHLDEQDAGRDAPLVVPAWAGPPDTDEAEIRIVLVHGRVHIRMTSAFAEAVRSAARATAPTSSPSP